MRIKTVITDIDGVMTDGGFVYTSEGKVSKIFGAHDGDGVRLLHKNGVNIIAISADKKGWNITKKRMDDMLITDFEYVPEAQRLNFVRGILKNTPAVAYVGDGFYDIAAMELCDVGFVPKGSLIDVASQEGFADFPKNAKLVPVPGGKGVIFFVAKMIVDEMF